MPIGTQQTITLSKDDLEELVEEIVTKTLVQSGLDASDSLANQADFRFTRQMRLTHESIKSKAIVTTVGLVITGGLALIVMGVVSYLHKGG